LPLKKKCHGTLTNRYATYIIRLKSSSEEVIMPIYVMLTTLTDTGRRAIQEDPETLREINKEVEYMGVKILDQYALLGQYDFVNILEAPSNEVMAKLATRLSARGNFQTLTLAAITIDALIDTLKQKEPPW
jgi:uncharacterized protein with GYD domain